VTALGLLPTGEDTAEWPVWTTTARVVVTEPARLAEATALVCAELAAIDKACSRFRRDSEVSRLQRAGGRSVHVTPLLAELLAAALRAAQFTDGDVDPTVGGALVGLGYDGATFARDQLSLRHTDDGWLVRHRPVPGWRRVHLDGRRLRVPPGVLLDLGATAKAYAADRCARLVADRCETGVLVSLGGDIATVGPAPAGGWRVLVQDRPGEPGCTVAMRAGTGLATSSTIGRRWQAGGRMLHHIFDPRTCLPAPVAWRTVSVAAASCLHANTVSTACVVRGEAAVEWLRALNLPARLVRTDGRVLTIGGWPATRAEAADLAHPATQSEEPTW
jgi:FAD:protein FMN transferase